MHLAKALRRLNPLKAPHRPDPLFDPAMVLLEMIIQIPVRAMAHRFPELSFDGAGIGVVSITGDPRRNTISDGACGAKESLCRRLVPLLTEQNIHQVPITINRAVEID